MIRKSGNRFSEKIMLKQEYESMIRKSGNRFSEKIMLKQEYEIVNRFNRIMIQLSGTGPIAVPQKVSGRTNA
jgi:phosphopantetheinyl transferase (holo-ACP synthase)